jgi:aerobic-type carbon monoxide dehydrogenase small subunit (CoxS/CutS family)
MGRDSDKAHPKNGVSRRSILKGIGLGSGAVAASALPAFPQVAGGPKVQGPAAVPIALNINGKDYKTNVEPRSTLLNTLRNQLDLTGTKLVCDRGSCGACTVHLDGKPVCSCLTLALDAQGKKITTIEGLAKGDQLDPVQAAFIEKDALQCGFCTPGMIMSVRALLNRTPSPSLAQVKYAVAGNLCRCGTYPRVFEAALAAARPAARKGA